LKRETRVKKELEGVQEELKETIVKSDNLKQDLIEVKNNNEALNKRILKLKLEMENMKQVYTNNIQIIQSEKAKECAEAKVHYEEETENLVKMHLNEVKELQNQFTRVQELLNKRYSRLELKFTEMQELYESRPSRKEDLDEIKKLHEESMNKDDIMKKLEGDAKFYKLELINREENYNKVFGVSPLVGIFNPIEKSDTSPIKDASPKRINKRKYI